MPYIAESQQAMEIDQQQLQFEYDNDTDTSLVVNSILECYDDLRNENTADLLTITLSDGQVIELDSEITILS